MEEKNLNTDHLKWIDSSIVVLFFAGILSFLLFTGTLNSGYHFTDDHEMLDINADLSNASFTQTSIKWIKNDLNIRFRPMYYLHRVFELKLLGANFFALSFYTGLLIASIFSLFYLGARKLKYSIIESLLLVLLAFTGHQMVIWWRLGPNETIGMVFLGLSFYFMARCAANKRRYMPNTILFNLFLILASLSKESFVIIIPAFAVYKVWNESRIFDISIKKSIRNNYLAGFSLTTMAVEMYAIVFVVGTNQIGYAGSSSSINELMKGVWTIFTSEIMLSGWLKFLLAIAILYFTSFLFLKPNRFERIKRLIGDILPPLLFSLLIISPNIVLYAKSGMMAHYLLPTTFGIAFLAISVLENIKNTVLNKTVLLACALFILASLSLAKQDAMNFTSEGKDTKVFLSAAKKNSKPDSKILLAADPVVGFEFSLSTKIYLASKGIIIPYGFPVTRNLASDFERGLKENWMKNFSNKAIGDLGGQPDIILLVYKNQTEGFFDESGLSQADYENIIENNPHAVYLKK